MTKQTKCSRSGDGWLGELRATKEIEDTAAFNKGPKPQKQKQDKDKKKKKCPPQNAKQATAEIGLVMLLHCNRSVRSSATPKTEGSHGQTGGRYD